MRPSLSLLEPEQTQVPQPFLLREELQSPNYPCCPLLDLLQELHVPLALRSPKMKVSVSLIAISSAVSPYPQQSQVGL